jgi:hypothetical protein
VRWGDGILNNIVAADERIPASPEQDPVLAMIGVGKEIWEKEDGDTFIRRLRDDSKPRTGSEVTTEPRV